MLQAVLRLLGVDLNRKIAEIRAQAEELKTGVIHQVGEQIRETSLTAGFVLIAAIAALLTFIVALAGLYLWVDMHEGPFAALGAVGLVTASLAALMLVLAFWRVKRGRAAAPVYPNPVAAPAPSPTSSVLLSAALTPLPPNASLFDVVTHRFSTRVAAASDEAIDAAVHVMRTSSRAALFGTLAAVVLVGVLIGRRR
jgi:hypothetical protein